MGYVRAYAIFCYLSEEQYNEFRSIFTDADKLPATFEEWKQLTKQLVKKLEGEDVIIFYRYADTTQDFIDFCRHHEIDVNAKGRNRFAELAVAGDIFPVR